MGNFNNWNVANGALSRLENSTFKGTFEIPTLNTYEFRYFVDGLFINEAEADGLICNDFAGAENSLLIV